VVDDEPIVRSSVGCYLQAEGFQVDVAEGGRQALDLIRSHPYGAVLLDVRMPGMDGIETLRELRRTLPSLPVVMMTAYADVATAVAAMKEGAAEYATKPFDPDELAAAIRRLVERPREAPPLGAVLTPGSESWRCEDFAGRSPAMARAMDLATRAAQTDVPVVLLGERGLGKERLARAIHSAGRRRDGPFVAVRTGGLTEGVLEAELFGYEQGVLPDSPLARKGRIEQADRGTLFVDEAHALPQRIQVALLDALTDRAVVRLGSETRRAVDVRTVVATGEDLESLAKRGVFLASLAGALAGVVVRIPPLRERPEDIAPLAERLFDDARRRLRREIDAVAPETLEALTRRPWPGNARELERTLERAIVTCPGRVLLPEHLGGA